MPAIDTELLLRQASIEPTTFDSTNRTIQVTFTTGAPVARFDWEGRYNEILEVSEAAVDLSEIRGAPVLNSHDRFDARSILGVVESASIANGRGVATVRFSSAPDVEPVLHRVREGTLRSVSVGYSISERRVEKDANGVRTLTATRWKPHELSFVAVPADPHARVRSDGMSTIVDIRSMCTGLGLSSTFAEGLIARNLSIEQARADAISELSRRSPVIDGRARVTHEANETLISRMADGLLARVNPRHTPTTGREFAHMSLVDMARRWLSENGWNTYGSGPDVLARSLGGLHTTSDFGNLFAELFNKSLLTLRTMPSPVTALFATATANDFRAKHVFEMADGPALLKVLEHGEIRSGTIASKELSSYKIDSYGRILGVTFAALVNDDVGALSDLNAKMTRGARQWFDSFLVDVIISNPKLADNKAVFHVDHANLASTGAAPSEASIAEGRTAMRMQTDASGVPLNNTARYILIPAKYETTVDALLATLYPPSPDEAVTAARGLVVLVDPRLDRSAEPNAWFMFSDPSLSPVFEYSELSGYQGPQVSSRQGFEILGTEIRVVWHLGGGAIDSRGGWKNPGSVSTARGAKS